ncbi:MAG: hypothetical protein PVH68_02030 [Armatimonadota bacterium]|jgi:hypothetical protein
MTSGSFANRAFWVLASIALALLVLFLVVFVNWMNGLHSLRAAEVDARARLAELKNAVTGVNTEDLQAQSDSLDTVLSVLELDLPQRAYVPTLLRQVETKALLTGNTHAEARLGELHTGKVITRPGAPAPGVAEGAQPIGQRYDEQELMLRFRGSYQSAFRLLKEMGAPTSRKMKMLFVKDISIQRRGNALRPDGGAEAEIDFDVTAFILEPAGGFPGRVVARVHD